jgi:hypothetical protein
VPNLEREFGFGREVGTLTISLFVAGYCCGPLLWGPASEQVGRKPVFLVAFLFYTGFQVCSSLLRIFSDLALRANPPSNYSCTTGRMCLIAKHCIDSRLPVPWWCVRKLPVNELRVSLLRSCERMSGATDINSPLLRTAHYWRISGTLTDEESLWRISLLRHSLYVSQPFPACPLAHLHNPASLYSGSSTRTHRRRFHRRKPCNLALALLGAHPLCRLLRTVSIIHDPGNVYAKDFGQEG